MERGRKRERERERAKTPHKLVEHDASGTNTLNNLLTCGSHITEGRREEDKRVELLLVLVLDAVLTFRR